jgi:hypothetical protein
MPHRRQAQESISNLSMDLIGRALELVQHEAFPVYKRNVDSREPPFAHGEFGPCAIATLLIPSGIDYHLARLKYFRDVLKRKRPLPFTPYFNWNMGVPLSLKIDRLLYKRSERRLKEQLIEFTIMRDSVAHPKLYLIRHLMNADYSITKQRAKLASGEGHRGKATERKLMRSERTRSLRLPLVPIWISYVDIVACILVLTRFLHLLEERYGNPSAWVGGFSVRNVPEGFFKGWGSAHRKSIPIGEWARAFYESLSSSDQEKVRRRLGVEVSRYTDKPVLIPVQIRGGSIGSMLRALQNPPPPDFLRKPPPWGMSHHCP